VIPLLRGSEEQCCWGLQTEIHDVVAHEERRSWAQRADGDGQENPCGRPTEETNRKASVSVRGVQALSCLASSVRSSSGRRGIRVHPPRMAGSQGTHNGRSALGHHHLGNVTRLHHEEVAESDFAAQGKLWRPREQG
jgi:hypothetical protein